MTTEEWRPVAGYPDYRVSSLGRVVSYRGAQPRELRGSHNQRGYRMVKMRSPDGDVLLRTVHRLVAIAFLGEPPAGMQVRHLDGDKANNAVANLTYGTASENILDQVAHGVHNMARKTHCKRDHEFTPENTRMYRGSRYCRACQSVRAAA